MTSVLYIINLAEYTDILYSHGNGQHYIAHSTSCYGSHVFVCLCVPMSVYVCLCVRECVTLCVCVTVHVSMCTRICMHASMRCGRKFEGLKGLQ